MIGLISGPYYKYRTYWDMLHSVDSYKSSYINHALQRAKRLPLYTILFLIGSHYFPLSVNKFELFQYFLYDVNQKYHHD